MGVLVTINILFMIFFFVLAYMSIRYFINQIEKYPRITLEEVYNSKKLRMKFNRLAAMQYLQIFKDTSLDKEYNFFIPDLRNSGKSDISKTKMGYCFGQDIYNTMLMLNEKFGKNNFVLYGFSQGGMGSAIAAKIFNNGLRKKGIKVDKMILDSSIANIRKRVKEDAK